MSLSNPEYSHSKFLHPIELDNKSGHIKAGFLALTLMAIGVVFGDIGTSPLYALKVCFDPTNGIPMTPESIFGVLSMIFWAFVIVVSLKYVLFVMRANNNGEGGILALMALALRTAKTGSKRAGILIVVGVLGACLFYGDAVITPAISVLSAIEGLSVVSDTFTKSEVPITLVILITLFIFEKKGTAIVGNLFGPIMIVWFLVIGAMGVSQILNDPEILKALNPSYAITFMMHDPKVAFAVTGAVFLVLTGAEALYADMGHFGIKPIQFAWFFMVMPCLLLNYFGQGALLMADAKAIENPFFLMVPQTYTLGLVILSTVATVIASQACISGAYSMTSQAILLGFVPRMKVTHTSEREIGQIYVPFINWILCLIVIFVVLAFQKSDNLAAAYGIAVSTTMLMTTLLAAVVMTRVWHWNAALVATIISVFIVVDIGFFAANLIKILEGGWFPLLVGSLCFLLLITWYQGRKLLRERAISNGIEVDDFMKSLFQHPPHRVEGTAIFLTAHIDFVPPALLHNLKHNKVLHERVIFMKISVWDVPRVSQEQRLSVKDLGNNVYLIRAIYGFKETPDISEVLELLKLQHQIDCPLMETSFFMARDSLVAKEIPQMSLWRESIFIWMMQNAARAADFFKVDSGRLIELGTKIEL
jgi:KUP system potassium uptake protein